jgi:hypothetical protein
MDEDDWNEYSPKVVEEKGVDAPGSDKYRASKVSCDNGAGVSVWVVLRKKEGSGVLIISGLVVAGRHWRNEPHGVCPPSSFPFPRPVQHPHTQIHPTNRLICFAFVEFMEDNHPSWDFATINPPLVFGPVIHQVESADKLK